MGSLGLLERSPDGQLVVVDIKSAARKYTDLQVEASLQLSVYSYATAMNGLADQENLSLRFDVLTKTRQPELPTATGPPATVGPTSGSSGSSRRFSAPSRQWSSIRWWDSTSRSASAEAAAGRGCVETGGKAKAGS